MNFVKPIATGAVFGLLTLLSCSNEQKFIGEWRSNNPENVVINQFAGNVASSITTIEFKQGPKPSDGDVVLSSDYDISFPDSVGSKTSLTGKCRAEGKWELDVDDDDDLLISYDYSTIKIDISGDSALATRVRPEVERLFRENLSRYSVVEDIEVNKEKSTLTMETGSAGNKVYFKRVTP